MPNFRIYFEQVNQEIFDIKSDGEHEAVRKAIKMWNGIHANPEPIDIETEVINCEEDE